MKTSITLAAVFFSFSVMAFAEDAPAPKNRAQQLFKNFDANSDGGISLDEYKAGMVGNMSPVRVESVFKEKDRNADGKLNLEELLYVPHDQRPAAPEKKDGAKDTGKAKTK